MAEVKIIEFDYHRNGIQGDGFFVARMRWRITREVELDKSPIFRVVYFPRDDDESTPSFKCAALREDMETIQMFAGNAWRGDRLVEVMHTCVMIWRDALRKGMWSYDRDTRMVKEMNDAVGGKH